MIMPGMKIKIPSSSKAVKAEPIDKSVKQEVVKEKPKVGEKVMPQMPKIPQMPVLGGDVNMESPKKVEKSFTKPTVKEDTQPEHVKKKASKPAYEHPNAYTQPYMPMPTMPMCYCQYTCPCCSQKKQSHMYPMGSGQMKEPLMNQGPTMAPPVMQGQNQKQWQGYPEQMMPQLTQSNVQHSNAYYPRYPQEQVANIYPDHLTNVPMDHHPMNHIQPTPPGFAPLQQANDREEN